MAKSKKLKLDIEPELVAQAAALYESLGLDLSTATRIFYLQSLRCHGLPFPLRADEPNDTTPEAVDEDAEDDVDELMRGPCTSFEQLLERMAALEAQDEEQKQAKLSKAQADSKIKLTEAPELSVTLGAKDEDEDDEAEGDEVDGDGITYGPFNSIEEMLEKLQELEAQSKNQDDDEQSTVCIGDFLPCSIR